MKAAPASRTDRQRTPKLPASNARIAPREREELLRRELKALRAELRRANVRLDALSGEIADIKAGPVDRFVGKVVLELEEGVWGEVLTELHALGDKPDAGQLRAEDLLDQLLMLRSALLAALGLRPFELRQAVRMPTSRARTFRWGDTAPMPAARSGSFSILSPGWARGDTVLLPPKIRIARRSASRPAEDAEEGAPPR